MIRLAPWRRAAPGVVLVLALPALLAWLSSRARDLPPETRPAGPALHEHIPLTGTIERQSRPVSITCLGKDRFAFADYRCLYFLTLVGPEQNFVISRPAVILPEKYIASLPTPVGDDPDNAWIRSVNTNPTGVYYDAADQSLYIANYGRHDVLAGKISPDGRRVLVNRVYKHPDLVSPENVAASRADNLVIIADFDAAGVFAFDMDGTLLWRHKYAGTHGVLIHDGHVYICNMTDRVRLAKFDREGHLLAECAETGRGDQQFLYPATLCTVPASQASTYGGPLLVVDAHQGSVTVLDENLRQVRRFHAPALPELALPYGLAISDDWLAIADTYNSRLLFGRHDLGQFQVVKLGNAYQVGSAPRPRYRSDHPHASQEKAPAALTHLVRRLVPGDYDVALGHQALYLFDRRSGDVLRTVLLPFHSGKYGFAARPGFGFAFSWATTVRRQGEEFVVVGSQYGGESPHHVMVLDARSGIYECIPVPTGLALRPMRGDSAEPLEQGLLQHFVATFAARTRDPMLQQGGGAMELAAYIGHYFHHVDSFLAHQEQLCFTKTAARLFERWRQGETIHIDPADFDRAGDPLVLDELYLLDLMSRTPLRQLAVRY